MTGLAAGRVQYVKFVLPFQNLKALDAQLVSCRDHVYGKHFLTTVPFLEVDKTKILLADQALSAALFTTNELVNFNFLFFEKLGTPPM